MSISGIGLSSSSSSANGPSSSHTLANSASSTTVTAAAQLSSLSQVSPQNEIVYHVRNGSLAASSARNSGSATSAAACAGDGGSKRIIFVRLTEAAIQQFERLALEQYSEQDSGSSRKQVRNKDQPPLPTPATAPTIRCFRRRQPATTTGPSVERSEGEITLPSSVGSAKLTFTITSANNCDNPRSSFECVKLRRRAVNGVGSWKKGLEGKKQLLSPSYNGSASGGNVSDGVHLGFFRHQFQVKTSEAESFSSTKRKLQEVKLEDQKSSTKGLQFLPEQAGRRTAVPKNSQSSSNLSTLLGQKKSKSYNQPGVVKPVMQMPLATGGGTGRLQPPAQPSSFKSSSAAASPLVFGSTTASAISPQAATVAAAVNKQHGKVAAAAETRKSNTNSPVISNNNTNSPPCMVEASGLSSIPTRPSSLSLKASTTSSSVASPLAAAQSSSSTSHTSGSINSSANNKTLQKTTTIVGTVPSRLPDNSNMPLAQASTAGAAALKPSVIVASGFAAPVSAGSVAGVNIRNAVVGAKATPPPPLLSNTVAALDYTARANNGASKNSSPNTAAGIALLRNAPSSSSRALLPGVNQVVNAASAASGHVGSRASWLASDEATSPKDTGNAAAHHKGSQQLMAASYQGASTVNGPSYGRDKLTGGNNSVGRPESAYSSGNESNSSHGVVYRPADSVGSLSRHAHGSSGPGSASSATSTSSSSSTSNSPSDYYEKLSSWADSMNTCRTIADRQRLTELYSIDWKEYCQLRDRMLKVRNKFDSLKAQLDMHRTQPSEYQHLADRIRYEYEQEMRKNYKSQRVRYDWLRTRLSRISSFIRVYDEKREMQIIHEKQQQQQIMDVDDDAETMLSSGMMPARVQQNRPYPEARKQYSNHAGQNFASKNAVGVAAELSR